MAKQVDTTANGRSVERGTSEEPLTKVLTGPNVISFIRLCMIPVFFAVFMAGHDVAATVIFALAAGTDWIDGQLARRTHQVSKLGKVLDPAVDRLLMIMGVIGVFVMGRVPLWIIVLVLARDISLMIGYAYLLKRWNVRVDVIYPGKVATTLFFVGFAALILNMPLIPGLGWVSVSWLPGFNAEPVGWGIWFIYAAMVLGAYTTTYYAKTAWRMLKEAKARAQQ